MRPPASRPSSSLLLGVQRVRLEVESRFFFSKQQATPTRPTGSCSTSPRVRQASLQRRFLAHPSLAAKPLVDSSTPHSYSAAQAIFHQPDLSTQLLTRFASANKATFKTLTTRKEWTFGERKVAAGKSLDELATKGVEAKTASDVLEALFDELAHQKRFASAS